MPPPVLVVEVVSPGKTNYERGYEDKRSQYQAREIPEYWLVDPNQQIVMVLTLEGNIYQETSFKADQRIISSIFLGFSLTAEQILNPPE
jgi:Uma2 family endonuclease